MVRTIKDFDLDWKYEREATMKILRALTDESLKQKVTPEGRSLGFLAWHLVLALSKMSTNMGLQVTGPAADSEQPEIASEIASAYDISSESVLEAVLRSWTDKSLDDEAPVFGEMWKRGKGLSSLILHQAHHRAQMTVLMRQAGLKVPGVYGPSKEEWALMGREPQR